MGPTLNGEGGRGGERGRDDQCGDEASGEVDVRALDEWKAHGHEDGAESNLQDREGLEGNARGDVPEGDAVECESDGATECEDVAEVDGREIGQEC